MIISSRVPAQMHLMSDVSFWLEPELLSFASKLLLGKTRIKKPAPDGLTLYQPLSRTQLTLSLAMAILFAQRNFQRDQHSDFKTCILVDLLELLLDEINKNRAPVDRITYNMVSSTQAGEYIKAQTDGSGDCDCILLISLCYGKQHHIVEERAKGAKDCVDSNGKYTASSFDTEILLADYEVPKHLTVYDLGLSDSDAGWHSPLYTLCTVRCIRNLRIRTLDSETKRRGRLDARSILLIVFAFFLSMIKANVLYATTASSANDIVLTKGSRLKKTMSKQER